MKKTATILEGKLVCLRKFKPSDAEAVYQICKDKQMARWTMGLPADYKLEHATAFIRKARRLARQNRELHFAITLKESGRLIGTMGLKRIDTTHKCAEIGFVIGRKYQAKGYATEAVGLILEFAFKKLRLYRVYGYCFEPNVASRCVFEKCRFKLEGTIRKAVVKYNKRQNMLHFGLLKDEYRRK